MKRILSIITAFILLSSFVSGDRSTSAQQAPTDQVSIIPLPVPTNLIGTFVRGASNDGRRLVFESINDYNGRNVDSNTEIYVYDVEQRSIIQITDTADLKDPADATKTTRLINNQTPAISGDGTKVVFVSNAALGGTTNDDGNYEVYVADLPPGATDPAAVRRITDTEKNSDTEVIDSIYNNYAPTINNDGSLIGFVSTRRVFKAIAGGASAFTALNEGTDNTAPDGNGEVFLYNANTRLYTQVTATRDSDTLVNFTVRGFNASPKLSGNGQYLVFLSGFNFSSAGANKNSDFNGEIFRYKVGDPVNTMTQVTETSGNSAVPIGGSVNVLPAFSKPVSDDGNRLVFESAGNFEGRNADQTREVFYADLSGATPVFRQITDQTTVDIFTNDLNFNPSINPSGTFIAFGSVLNLTPASSSSVTTDNADGSREIFRYDIANSSFRQLTFTPQSLLVADQRSSLRTPYVNSAGDLISFTAPARDIAPNSAITDDLFQALIRPVTSTNSEAAKMTNAASFKDTEVARGSLVALFGTQLSNGTMSAASTNLPFVLNGVTVTVGSLAARLIYVSPGQINLVMPVGVANGDSVDFTINNNGVQSAGKIKIVDISAGVFTITGDGMGSAAAQCGTVSPDGMSFLLTAPPCRVGNDAQLNVLTIYGTGWRNTASLQVKVGDVTLSPTFAGAQPDFPGLDQINVTLSKDLADKQDLDLSVIPLTTNVESNKSKISFLPLEDIVNVSNGASFEATIISPGASAVGQGTGLAETTATSPGTTELEGVKVSVAGLAALITAISPERIDFVVPAQVQPSMGVEVVVDNNGKIFRGRVTVLKASPGLFTTTNDGAGRARALCGKVNTDGSVTYTDPPCAVGTEASPNVLRLFGTGWRLADSVSVKIGDTDITPTFAGAQAGVPGADIIDLKLVPALAGRTDVDVIVTTTVNSVGKVSKSGIKISFSNQ
ncbi:MAG: PD40 domain-containing protein [Acidobacteriota bacterium]|nr:MAG: PD40 domain-containing protein [Acidobacteriota bacterium]